MTLSIPLALFHSAMDTSNLERAMESTGNMIGFNWFCSDCRNFASRPRLELMRWRQWSLPSNHWPYCGGMRLGERMQLRCVISVNWIIAVCEMCWC